MDLVTLYFKINREYNPETINSYVKRIFYSLRPEVSNYFKSNSSIFLLQREYYESSTEIPFEIPFEIDIWSEEGSIKYWIKVSLIPTFIFYGEIRQSIDSAYNDAQQVSKYIKQIFLNSQDFTKDEVITNRTYINDPQKLLRLFRDVENRKISPERATEKALQILEPEKYDIPRNTQLDRKLLNEFKKSYNTSRYSHHLTKPKMIMEKPEAEIIKSYKERRGVHLKWSSQDEQLSMYEY